MSVGSDFKRVHLLLWPRLAELLLLGTEVARLIDVMRWRLVPCSQVMCLVSTKARIESIQLGGVVVECASAAAGAQLNHDRRRGF